MKCPECEKAGVKSVVYPGMGMTTLLFCQPFYDEDGKYHHHDSNRVSFECRCSEGHEWVHEEKPSCWCGWPESGPYAESGKESKR